MKNKVTLEFPQREVKRSISIIAYEHVSNDFAERNSIKMNEIAEKRNNCERLC